MIFSNDELLEIIEQVTLTFGELLLRHRQLTEGLVDDQRIATLQDRIEKRRAEIDQERDRIRKVRDGIRRRRELEKISKEHEKEVTAESKSTATTSPILDGKGAVIGWIQRAGGSRMNILDRKGKVVARFTGQVLALRP